MALNKQNLQLANPNLSSEWHPTKNGNLVPKDVTPNSGKKVWWLCPKGHEWKAFVFSRNNGHGCPYCSGRKASDENCLQALNPKLSKEWHPVKNNSLTPKDVTKSSHKKVWWICKKGHEWVKSVNDRNRGYGCPYCSGRRVCEDNCLQTVNPGLSKEWHPVKNIDLTPKDFTANSRKIVWWTCNKGHVWKARIWSRNAGRGCPYCSGRKN